MPEMSTGTFHTIETIALLLGIFGNIFFTAIKVSGRLSIMENDIKWIKGHLGITSGGAHKGGEQ